MGRLGRRGRGAAQGLGEFNATVSGLTAGETYYFRAFATSADGTDWSNGDPQVRESLVSNLRFDENNGSLAYDSTAWAHDARFQGDDSNATRLSAFAGRGLTFNGRNNWLDLDANASGFLAQSFDGRSVSFRVRPASKVFTGPAFTRYDSVVAYYPMDEGSGTVLNDLGFDVLNGDLGGSPSWSGAQFGQGLNLDGTNDVGTLSSEGKLARPAQGLLHHFPLDQPRYREPRRVYPRATLCPWVHAEHPERVLHRH